MDEEVPVGSSNGPKMEDEFGSAGGPAEVDNRPLAERIGDKNWKARLTAYEDLKKELKATLGEDPLFAEYASWIPKMTSDSHPGALDAGLDTALMFVDMDPTNSFKPFTDKICTNIVDKSFGARPATQAKGKALLMKMMEVDETAPITAVLLAKLSDKKPKVPPACLETIKDGVLAFGARAYPIKDIISSMPALLNGSNAPARELALLLVVELTRWIGRAPFNTLVEGMRAAQKVDFEKLCTEQEAAGQGAKPLPSLYLRKDRPTGSSVSLETTNLIGKASIIQPTSVGDDREFIEEVDLSKKLKSTEYASLVCEEKWEPQLRGLQMIIDTLGSAPKIKPGSDLNDYVATIKAFLRQGHITVQVAAMKVVGLFADGARGEFAGLARSVSQLVVLKCKEKKLCDPLSSALTLILRHCLSFESLYEDFNEQIRSKKVPTHGRVCLLEFVISGMREIPEKFATEQLKGIADMFISCCEDSDPKIREVCTLALVALGPLVRSRGRAALEAHKAIAALETNVPRVFKKIQAALDASAGAGVPASAAAGSSAAGSSAIASSAPRTLPAAAAAAAAADRWSDDPVPASKPAPKPAVKPTGAPRQKLSGTMTKPAPTAASSDPTSKKTAKKSADEEDDAVEDLAMTLEAAREVLAGLAIDNWTGSFQELMLSAKWQEKVDALAVVEKALQAQQSGGLYSAALVVYLQGTTSNFKISNINIIKAIIQTSCAAAQNVGSAKFSKSAAWVLLREFGDKLSDKKTSALVCGLLTSLSEAVSPTFVVKRMKHVLDKVKAPVAHEAFLVWLKDAIKEFGSGVFPIAFLGSLSQTEMENRDVKVRTAAIEAMGALYNQIGPKLLAVAVSDDMKPALRAILDAEFAKVGYDPSQKATRGVKGEDSSSSGTGGGIPRQDLAELLDKNILSEMNLIEGKTSWQNRKAAIEAVVGACEKSGHYLEANKGTVEIVKALKTRLADTQANLKPIAANAISHVVASLEPESGSKLLRAVAAALVSTLGDNKLQMRTATVCSLQMIVTLGKDASSSSSSPAAAPPAAVDANLLNVLVPPLGEILGSNTVCRMELLSWLIQHVSLIRGQLPGKPDDNLAADLTVPLVNAMQDKTAAVRSLSEQMLSSLMARGVTSRAVLDKATRDLPPAVKRTLQPSIDRMNLVFGTRRPGTSPAATTITTLEPEPQVEPAAPVKPLLPPPKPAAAVQKPVTAASQAPEPPAASSSPKKTGTTTEPSTWSLKKTVKQKRCDDFHKTHWPQPPEEVGEAEMAALRSVWEPLITAESEMLGLLFPLSKAGSAANQDGVLPALAELTIQLDGPHALQHSDLILRWCMYALCMRETSTGLLKILQFVTLLFERMRGDKASIHENEMGLAIPHLVEKSGHKSERHKAAFIVCLKAAGEIVPPNKLCQLLLQGLACKNKKTRVVCIEEIQHVVEGAGAGSLGRAGVKEIAGYLDSKDNDVSGRHACLELSYVLFISLGSDQGKLMKLMGEMSERSVAMVEERIRQKLKGSGTAASAPAALPPAPTVVQKSSSAAVVAAAPGPSVKPLSSIPPPLTHAATPPKKPSPSRVTAASTSPTIGDMSFQFDHSPFKLEMTPPGSQGSHGEAMEEKESPIVNRMENILSSSSSPVMVASKESLQAFTPPASLLVRHTSYESSSLRELPQEAELEGIYLDIAGKLNCLLSIPECLPATSEIHDDAREYLKMLHLVVTGAWAKETLPEDEEALNRQAVPMLLLLLRCLDRSFLLPSLSSLPQQSFLGIDLSLASLSLANIYAYISREDVSAGLSEDCAATVFGHCIERLIDAKLKYSVDDSGSVDLIDDSDFGFTRSVSDLTMVDTALQLTRALNILILRLAQQAPAGVVFGSLLRLIKGCIPELRTAAKRIAAPGSKVISRLILRVVSDEVAKVNSFQRSPEMLRSLLYSLHCFFDGHPEITTDEIPFCTAKTLLDQVIKSVGSNQIVSAISALALPSEVHRHVPKTSLLSKLIGKYVVSSTQSIGSLQMTTGSSDAFGEGPQQHQEMVTIIDNITSARDKSIPIKKLHDLVKENPEIDVHQYLQRISSAFRKFVLDALTKLDNGSALRASAEKARQRLSVSGAKDRVSPAAAVSSAHSNSRSSFSDASGGSEAMRIIEGLKRVKADQPVVAPPAVGADTSSSPSSALKPLRRVAENIMRSRPNDITSSPRSQINAKIRGSLNSLTASLDAPAAVGDGDLAARLARLRNMSMSAPAGTATITPHSGNSN